MAHIVPSSQHASVFTCSSLFLFSSICFGVVQPKSHRVSLHIFVFVWTQTLTKYSVSSQMGDGKTAYSSFRPNEWNIQKTTIKCMTKNRPKQNSWRLSTMNKSRELELNWHNFLIAFTLEFAIMHFCRTGDYNYTLHIHYSHSCTNGTNVNRVASNENRIIYYIRCVCVCVSMVVHRHR